MVRGYIQREFLMNTNPTSLQAEFLLCDQTIQSGETAMHRALFCQDIVEAIFGHLLLNPAVYRSHDHFVRDHHNKAEEREHRHALASAARVSKAISEIALSILWSQLPTFRHLVRLLPQYNSVLDVRCYFSHIFPTLIVSEIYLAARWATDRERLGNVREICSARPGSPHRICHRL